MPGELSRSCRFVFTQRKADNYERNETLKHCRCVSVFVFACMFEKEQKRQFYYQADVLL